MRRTAPGEPPEADLVSALRDAARLGGWLAYHTHDSRRSDPGWPDLVLVRGAEMLAVEVKSARGRVRPEQAAWLDALAGVAGVSALLVRGEAETAALAARLMSRG